jgi:adenine-specific DNA methylase
LWHGGGGGRGGKGVGALDSVPVPADNSWLRPQEPTMVEHLYRKWYNFAIQRRGSLEDTALPLERDFDATFATKLALREKQIQQNYRPLIGVHKWFARRPGTMFRSLLLAELNGSEPLSSSYWRGHSLTGVIADPFMGGGTTIYEANRLGFSVIGADVNPMAYWIVRQSLAELDLAEFRSTAAQVIADVWAAIGALYKTTCIECGESADVKYFLWVKTASCPTCLTTCDLFPGYLLAEAIRHPRHVVACSVCGALNEFDSQPSQVNPGCCQECASDVFVEGPARRKSCKCRGCGTTFPYPRKDARPPEHRMWAIEYHCARCKAGHKGRFFKVPDNDDLHRFMEAERTLSSSPGLPIPDDDIPPGDETDRLLRWGYAKYRDMFNARQLLSLGTLLSRLMDVKAAEIRHALLTVFSDFLRYQNMLCRYDTMALKCQDIFSVHGFPVGLIQCENNVLGIDHVGSGAFRHFVEKFIRAKEYAIAPFETRATARAKSQVPISGESIRAKFVDCTPNGNGREALIEASPAETIELSGGLLDGVFTDPPYFDNVQYAELIDFCYVWLRKALQGEISEFRATTTRTSNELTGNITLGRGLETFADGLSKIFSHYADALKPGAPFVFTYHHNDESAYVPVVLAILDSGLKCTAVLPAAAEMAASMHIAGTSSSVLDSVFVCRREAEPTERPIRACLGEDAAAMRAAGLKLRPGDLRCLTAGHIAGNAVNRLAGRWRRDDPLADRFALVRATLQAVAFEVDKEALVSEILKEPESGLQHALPI